MMDIVTLQNKTNSFAAKATKLLSLLREIDAEFETITPLERIELYKSTKTLREVIHAETACDKAGHWGKLSKSDLCWKITRQRLKNFISRDTVTPPTDETTATSPDHSPHSTSQDTDQESGTPRSPEAEGGGDAAKFLETVRKRFEAEPKTYFEFLELMRKSHNGKLGMPAVIAEINRLFSGHADLREGFQKFVEKENEPPSPCIANPTLCSAIIPPINPTVSSTASPGLVPTANPISNPTTFQSAAPKADPSAALSPSAHTSSVTSSNKRTREETDTDKHDADDWDTDSVIFLQVTSPPPTKKPRSVRRVVFGKDEKKQMVDKIRNAMFVNYLFVKDATKVFDQKGVWNLWKSLKKKKARSLNLTAKLSKKDFMKFMYSIADNSEFFDEAERTALQKRMASTNPWKCFNKKASAQSIHSSR